MWRCVRVAQAKTWTFFKMKQMEAFFIFQLIIITRAGHIEIGWKLVRSAPRRIRIWPQNGPNRLFRKSKKSLRG